MKKKLSVFDPAEYLTNQKRIEVYLNEAFKTGDSAYILHAIGVVARAKGMTKIARSAGVSREGLYKALASDGKPEFSTVLKSLKAAGFELKAKAA